MINIAYLSRLSAKELNRIMGRNSVVNGYKLKSLEMEVASILKRVRKGRDREVQKYNLKWSKKKAQPLLYTEADFVNSLCRIPVEVKNSLIKAAKEIRNFHKKQLRKNIKYRVQRSELGIRYVPHENVAVYVPGGKGRYPSSVLMGVIPARLAGVKKITILSPPAADGKVNDYVLAAALITEASALYAAGGAQAIAAAVYGTESIDPVSLVVGPGNNYVTRAKWQLFAEEKISIDCPAGPSEVLIIAEKIVPAHWLAADLLSQAEHGEDSSCILLTVDENFAMEVRDELEKRLKEKSRRNSIKIKAIKKYGKILIARDLIEAIDFSNRFAPEHLQIVTSRDSYVLDRIKNAGSVFIGPYSPVAAGDYSSGTNHILPTGGMAGVFSGLGVENFYRSFTYQKLSKKRLSCIAPVIKVLAKVEGFDEEHGRSVDIRLR